MDDLIVEPSQLEFWKFDLSVEGQIHDIKSDLLGLCMGFGHGSSESAGEIAGLSWSKQSFGYVILSYLAEKALDFRRLPFCIDRVEHWAYSQEEEIRRRIREQLTEEKINFAVAELRQIYLHTQSKLKEKGVEKILLTRQLKRNSCGMRDGRSSGYAENLIKIKDAADLLNLDFIEFEMDTLNSFGSNECYLHWADVTIQHEYEIQDILYCADLVSFKGNKNFNESGEWLVLNRSPTGMVRIPTGSIFYDKKCWQDLRPFRTNEEAELFLIENKLPLRGRTYYESTYGNMGIKPKIRQRLIELLRGDWRN